MYLYRVEKSSPFSLFLSSFISSISSLWLSFWTSISPYSVGVGFDQYYETKAASDCSEYSSEVQYKSRVERTHIVVHLLFFSCINYSKCILACQEGYPKFHNKKRAVLRSAPFKKIGSSGSFCKFCKASPNSIALS